MSRLRHSNIVLYMGVCSEPPCLLVRPCLPACLLVRPCRLAAGAPLPACLLLQPGLARLCRCRPAAPGCMPRGNCAACRHSASLCHHWFRTHVLQMEHCSRKGVDDLLARGRKDPAQVRWRPAAWGGHGCVDAVAPARSLHPLQHGWPCHSSRTQRVLACTQPYSNASRGAHVRGAL